MAGKLSSMFGAQDMTQGSPVGNLVKFSVPLLIGNLAQQLYSTVDSIVVGNYVGDGALAAVGASGPILNLLLVLFMGISVGASIMVSQYYGAGERENLSETVGTTITATLLSSAFIMVLGPLITRPVMAMLDTPADIYEMSCEYLVILFLGIIGCAYYNIISGVLRGLGDSIMPLIFLVVACLLNIVLDIWFVAGFQMGVAGVAWATILAQAVSGALCLWRLMRMKDVLTVNLHTLRPKSLFVKKLVQLGLPSGLTQAIFSFAMIIIQSLTNSFGTAVIAANTVVMRVDGFAMMPNFTFGTAMTTYTGQNIGANRVDRVEEGTKGGLKIGLAVSVVLVGLILLFGKYLMEMFTSTPEVIDLGQQMLRTLAVGYVAMAVTQILSGVMRGAGDTMTPMWISIITTVVIRVPIAYGLEFFTRPEGGAMGSGAPTPLFLSLLLSWVIGAVLTAIAYRMGRWKKKSIISKEEKA
ncbi:MATE family efflux transporter [bacterium D16-76]|nr:MATE family efflux transporter [bacterium D16-76]